MIVKKILKSSLFQSSGIYTITSVVNAAIPFLLIPILTRVFSTADYGIVSMITIIINIVTPFIGISANGAIHRKYFDEDSNLNFPRYVGNAFVLLLLSAIFFLFFFLLFGDLISKFTSVPAKWLYVILIIAVCQFVTLILLTIWQVKVKPLNYGLLQIIQSLINVGLSLYFIYQLRFGWESRILGQLIAVLLTAGFSLVILIRLNYIKFEFNIIDLKDIVKFSLPLIPHTLGGLMIAFTDRILITNMIGVNDTGVYTVAYQIGSVLNLLNVSFINAYVPWLYNKLNANDAFIKMKIVKFTYAYFFIMVIIALISALVLPIFIQKFVGKSFGTASIYTFWIILGYVFNGMYLMVAGFIFYVKKTALLSKITFATAILNIPICYLFLRNFGTLGAAMSMSLVYCISFICTWVLSNRVYKMPWFKLRRI